MSDSAGTKEKILEVARSHFARNGYHGTSMDSIVKGTNLSKGAIYWHFKGKKELFEAVLGDESNRVLKYLFPGPGDLDGGAAEFFVRRGEQYFEALWNDTEMRLIWLTLFIEAQRGGEDGRDLSLVAGNLLNSLHETLRPVLMEAFPGLTKGSDEMSLENIMMIVDFLFDGMVMNLGLRLDLATAKSYWRFVVHRFIDFEGEK
ncbi:MAG: TetR/AcrR family transcriptional regulator [Thermovirgaceae bacterium]|nr:TetR/AcrR family transcriptional regulator [Thermovirgaceae bacterium]